MKRGVRIFFYSAVCLSILGGVGWLLLPSPPTVSPCDYSQIVLSRRGELLRLTLTEDDKYRCYTSLEEISPHLIAATLAYEDRFYWRHPGVNPLSILRAGWGMWRGVSRSGASTITMQVARLRYGLETSHWQGKLSQMYRALQLERHYSKSQILEMYFNLLPYGGNVEGIGAASQLYLGKVPGEITAYEAIALAVIPQSPHRRRPFLGSANPCHVEAQQRFFTRYGARVSLSELAGEFRLRAGEMPHEAPHLVRLVLGESPHRTTIATTLDLELQSILERGLAEYVERHRARGISNAAALLVDRRSLEVLAQVGSVDFWDASIQGQVDGTSARRSPGSTLKPFLFGRAIDEGVIHPLSILADIPRHFRGYRPENFDRTYAGPIAAGNALQRSRNIPALTLSNQVEEGLYALLQKAHVELPYPEEHYGLSLSLGGAELTMGELVALYAMLGNGGVWRPLTRRQGKVPTAGEEILSAEAAFLVLEMLRDGEKAIYWKTGTSNGFRDGWTLALFDDYVIAVWIGNFDGRPNPAFVARDSAAPLCFELIDRLRSARPLSAQWVYRPPASSTLKRQQFCALSGDFPRSRCRHLREGWHVAGVSPIRRCRLHREVEASDGGEELSEVWAALDLEESDSVEGISFWDSSMQQFFQSVGLPLRTPSSGSETSTTMLGGGGELRILSPEASVVYSTRGHGAKNVSLRACAEADVARVFWYAGKQLLGSSAPQRSLFWNPPAGVHHLTVVDDRGRSHTRRVVVESMP